MSGCRWRAGWRVATVADSHVGAVGGAGARIRGVVSGWQRGWRPVEAPATPLAPFLSQLLPCHIPRPCTLALCAEGDWALERGVGLGWTRTLRERARRAGGRRRGQKPRDLGGRTRARQRQGGQGRAGRGRCPTRPLSGHLGGRRNGLG
eukprot:scaffold3501_cov113-Isochrysis_galbana.AAC.2